MTLPVQDPGPAPYSESPPRSNFATTVWLECYAGKFFLLKIHTPTHISLESLYKAGHDEIVNGAIKHL